MLYTKNIKKPQLFMAKPCFFNMLRLIIYTVNLLMYELLHLFNTFIKYVISVKSICNMLFQKSKTTNDKKLQFISIMIFNYLTSVLKQQGLDYSTIEMSDNINIVPLLEYKDVNHIELYDLQSIDMNDLDVANENDIERFVLSHIFYMFQK